jgi:uncharacterized membrane protein
VNGTVTFLQPDNTSVRMKLKLAPPYYILTGIVAIAAILRFWNLDGKPLWLDEVITALLSLGHTTQDIPMNQWISSTILDSIFSLKPGLTCAQIATNVATDSVHPPLFFCLLYRWLQFLPLNHTHWVWELRSLPAFLGVVGVFALYHLNCRMMSPAAGLAGAALLAVSPFAVYLSQEARHYTLPMVLVTLGLIGLVAMQRDITEGRYRPWVWLGWVGVNSVGLYTHYFVLLAIAAQLGSLTLWTGWQQWHSRRLVWKPWGAIALAVLGGMLTFLPWLPTFLGHVNRPETSWIATDLSSLAGWITPLLQTIAGWTLFIIALPVENQSRGILLLSGFLTLGAIAWFLTTQWQRRHTLHHLYRQHPGLGLLSGVVFLSVLEFWVMIYGMGKDLSVVPRYNFVFFPAVSAVLGGWFALDVEAGMQARRLRPLSILIGMGLISSVFVIGGWVFQKPFYPVQTAQTMYQEPQIPLLVATSVRSLQDVALGLSFDLELHELEQQSAPSSGPHAPLNVSFISREKSYREVWDTLRSMETHLRPPANLWMVASPDLRSRSYPNQLAIAHDNQTTTCRIDREELHRIGYLYQLYRCT